jgi:hypothetical protein
MATLRKTFPSVNLLPSKVVICRSKLDDKVKYVKALQRALAFEYFLLAEPCPKSSDNTDLMSFDLMFFCNLWTVVRIPTYIQFVISIGILQINGKST